MMNSLIFRDGGSSVVCDMDRRRSITSFPWKIKILAELNLSLDKEFLIALEMSLHRLQDKPRPQITLANHIEYCIVVRYILK